MKKILVIFINLIILVNFNFAQEKLPKTKRSECKNHFGITGGYSTGYGISYLYQENKFGLQATFSPYYNDNRKFTNFALTGLYLLQKGQNINLMMYLSNDWTSIIRKNSYDSSVWESMKSKTGIGLAYQMYMSPKYKICFYTGYSVLYFKDEYDKYVGFAPDGGVSLYFMF